jgi:hypothetical protein
VTNAFNIATQLWDDLQDWKEDLRRGAPSLLLARLARLEHARLSCREPPPGDHRAVGAVQVLDPQRRADVHAGVAARDPDVRHADIGLDPAPDHHASGRREWHDAQPRISARISDDHQRIPAR